MSSSLYSDNQNDVDALARRIAALTSLSSKQAAVISRGLLGRKVLKIKSSSLGGLFRSIDKDIDTKRLRDEFIKSGLIERIDETGVDGRPAIYSICAKVSELIIVDGAEDLNDGFDVEEETAPAETLAAEAKDTGQAAPAAAACGSEKDSGLAKSAVPRAEDTRCDQELPATAPSEAAQKEEAKPDDNPVAFVSKVGRGARVHRRAQDKKASRDTRDTSVEQPRLAEPKGQEPEVHAVGPQKQQPQAQDAPSAPVEKKASAPKEPAVSKKGAAFKQAEANRGRVAFTERDTQRKHEDAKEGEARSSVKKEAPANRKRKGKPGRSEAVKSSRKQDSPSTQPMGAHHSNDSVRSESRSIVRVIRGQLAKVATVLPLSAVAHGDRVQYAKITRVDNRSMAKTAVHENGHQNAKQQLAHDFEAITTWIEQTDGMDTPYASRRQRAFEIFNDEKAFDGKRGERLFKRLNDRGVNVAALKITPQRPYHFTSFFGIGANKPFIMVENIDTYDEIARLLRGKSSVKLFGVRVSGVIFGSGCKASVSHALDDYLSDIGYGYDYVYYAGDIDREGARIVEQARAANNTKIRMHAGMYKAMLAAHKRRLKDGRGVEHASENQGVPQNLARAIADLPMVTRMQFRNILREGGRIPQEILTSADYRDSSSGSLDRILNS
ncbi:hypothetical protein [Collinsella bouchesdurhonensis]|uniref:hypothetical protein n=1 Tax=Collinsella bouchesdurhonensis TaxID=1907654 RepID=UPI001105FB75|nr:hypothetical protein [Collinsella bouchesdurhonensis]